MPFLSTDVAVERVDDKRWRLTREVTYQGQTETFTVPAGFVTDFASVPRFVTWLVPVTGRYTEGSVLHDWCCEVGIAQGLINPVDTDGLFRRVMREEGVPWLLRWLIWLGIRLGATWTPARRPGWWRTAPIVIPATLLVAPLLAPAVLLVLATLGLFGIIGAAASDAGLK